MSAHPFTFPIRVYYEDTDAGGVVYHAGYVRFIERARTEYLRARGIGQARLTQELGLIFVVTELALKFLKPARLDDELLASCVLTERGGASLRFSQQLVRPRDNAVLVEADVRAACLTAADFRPHRIPRDLPLE
jgi:acyl-CoA thioester hydrolase